MEKLKSQLDELMQKLPDATAVRSRLNELYSVYPFNEFEYIISTLLGHHILTLDEYYEIRDNYMERNSFLYIFEISAPRTFGEAWVQGHLKELVPELSKPSRKLDSSYSGQYDFFLDEKIRIEVKASRAVDAESDEPLYVKALTSDSLRPFWMNFQQVKPACCDVFVWIAVMTRFAIGFCRLMNSNTIAIILRDSIEAIRVRGNYTFATTTSTILNLSRRYPTVLPTPFGMLTLEKPWLASNSGITLYPSYLSPMPCLLITQKDLMLSPTGLSSMLNPLPFLPTKQRIRQAFDQAATNYDAAAEVQREVSDRLAAHLIQAGGNLNPDTILDAGGGTGYGARQLQAQWPDTELTVIDFAPRMLIAARDQLAAARLICADIEHLPVADASFDLYWSSLAWQWNDPQRCLAEARRVLKPGGALAVATLGADNFPELRHAFADIDDYGHVLTIPAPEHLLTACQASDCEVWRWDRQPVRRWFPDLRTLLRSVKAVGAREVDQRRPTPLSRSAWQALTARYEALREPAGLPLTYDAVWLIAIRP